MVDIASEPLAADFPPPDRSAWLALVERSLKGAPLDSLTSRTPDGLEIQPLYTAAEARGRLISGAADPAQPWDIRSTVDDPDPARANQQALEDLENGANSLHLRIDPTGRAGVCVGDAAALARVLDGVVLEVATVALDAGWAGAAAARWLADAAKGSPAAKLALHMDPLGALASSGESPGPAEAHLATCAETAAGLIDTYPQATGFLASGAVVHEAGGTEAAELGFMAASLVAYARAFDAVGVDPVRALPRIVAGVSVDGDYFTSIAKLRAARLICRRIHAACGVQGDDRSLSLEARSSSRMLSRVDAWTNLLRLTAAGFAAAAGGAGAVVLSPFTEPLGRPTTLARRQSRNIQLLLMQESHVGRVRDPAAGAWSVEAMTNQLAEQGWAVFQTIEKAGGVLEALKSGWVAANVEGAAAALRTAAERRGILGVTKFPNPQERPAPTEPGTAIPEPSTPDWSLPGPASVCRRLEPMRISETFEDFDGALT